MKFQDELVQIYFLNISVPLALLFLNTSISVAYSSILTAAYHDERIFPFSRKVSAISTIFMFSKIITIGAPLVNEIDEPIPIAIIIMLQFFAILLNFFYKSKEELAQMKVVGRREGEEKEGILEEMMNDKQKELNEDDEFEHLLEEKEEDKKERIEGQGGS